jgi:Zn-dependent protease
MARKDYNKDYREPEWHHPQDPGFEQHRDPHWYDVGDRPKKKKVDLKFSTTEIKQLAVATLVITAIFGLGFAGVGLFTLLSGQFDYGTVAISCGIALVAAGSAFVIHELAHKFVAQRYGCWAEFRYNLVFLLGSAFLALLLNFFIIVPGAVYIRGHLTKKQNGMVSAAGPLTNIIIGALFTGILFIGLYSNIDFVFYVGFLGAFINFFIGAFNMIPIGNLDGGKILKWNPLIWVVMAVLLGGPVLYLWLGMY